MYLQYDTKLMQTFKSTKTGKINLQIKLCTKCENLAKIHRWKSCGAMIIYALHTFMYILCIYFFTVSISVRIHGRWISTNVWGHKNLQVPYNSVAKLDGWPTDEDAQLHTFYCHCNIIKTQRLIEFLSVTTSVAISVNTLRTGDADLHF